MTFNIRYISVVDDDIIITGFFGTQYDDVVSISFPITCTDDMECVHDTYTECIENNASMFNPCCNLYHRNESLYRYISEINVVHVYGFPSFVPQQDFIDELNKDHVETLAFISDTRTEQKTVESHESLKPLSI